MTDQSSALKLPEMSPEATAQAVDVLLKQQVVYQEHIRQLQQLVQHQAEQMEEIQRRQLARVQPTRIVPGQVQQHSLSRDAMRLAVSNAVCRPCARGPGACVCPRACSPVCHLAAVHLCIAHACLACSVQPPALCGERAGSILSQHCALPEGGFSRGLLSLRAARLAVLLM